MSSEPSKAVEAPPEDNPVVKTTQNKRTANDNSNKRRFKRAKPNYTGLKPFAENHAKNEVSYTSANSSFTLLLINIKGIFDLCEAVYSSFISRDRQLIQYCSLFTFQYTSYCLAFIKMLRLDAYRGKLVPQLSCLNEYFEHILVPTAIADFIDSLGKVKTPNGITVIPTLGDIYRSTGHANRVNWTYNLNPLPIMLSDRDMWTNWHEDLPPLNCSEAPLIALNVDEFGIASSIIVSYIQMTGRLLKYGTLRTCDKSLEGTPTQLVSLRKGHGSGCVPASPYPIEIAHARKGIAYAFHDEGDLHLWPDSNKSVAWPLCSGPSNDRDIVLAELARNVIRA